MSRIRPVRLVLDEKRRRARSKGSSLESSTLKLTDISTPDLVGRRLNRSHRLITQCAAFCSKPPKIEAEFGDKINLMLDGGIIKNKSASKIYMFDKDNISQIR